MTTATSTTDRSLTTALDRTRLTPFRDPLPVPPVIRPATADGAPSVLRMRMRTTWGRLHSELPTTRLWTYEGHFPGPTIEVRRGQRLRVEWVNALAGPYPVLAVTKAPPLSQNRPGAEGLPDPAVAALRPWTVVHLHGGRTAGGSDGRTESAVATGESVSCDYANDQRATMLWYHDHAMGITRLNVVAGLAGLYVVRDEEEAALDLPAGQYEIPLLLADRNLFVDGDGMPRHDAIRSTTIRPTPTTTRASPIPCLSTGCHFRRCCKYGSAVGNRARRARSSSGPTDSPAPIGG